MWEMANMGNMGQDQWTREKWEREIEKSKQTNTQTLTMGWLEDRRVGFLPEPGWSSMICYHQLSPLACNRKMFSTWSPLERSGAWQLFWGPNTEMWAAGRGLRCTFPKAELWPQLQGLDQGGGPSASTGAQNLTASTSHRAAVHPSKY